MHKIFAESHQIFFWNAKNISKNNTQNISSNTLNFPRKLHKIISETQNLSKNIQFVFWNTQNLS